MTKKTERELLLEDLYNPDISASRKEAIMSTFPDFMHHKGVCNFSVDDIEKAEQVLNEHMNGQYFQEKKDYLNEEIFKPEGYLGCVCHGKFSIDRPDLFMRLLITRGVRLFYYDIASYESYYGRF